MTRKKKGIFLVSVLLVICLLTSAVAVVAKKANESVVTVIPVESIYMESYVESTNVEGNVATSATQKVKVAKDTTIEQVYVKQGDRVHKGEKISHIRYDADRAGAVYRSAHKKESGAAAG